VAIIEFIQESNECASIEALTLSFEKYITQIGFDKFVYSLMRGSVSKFGNTHHGIARSYPETWMKHYVERNYIKFDPTYRWAIKHRGAFTWQHMQKTLPLTKGERRVMLEADEAGLKNGVSLSIYGPQGEVMGFGFASSLPKLDINKNDLSILHALSNQFHLAYMALQEAHNTPTNIVLSDRQRDILRWMAVGKDRTQIADIMSISEETVKAYLKDIYCKLGCSDKAVAVLRAFQLGLIAV
jgi:DNA-binding CsgD family transcriptional regulator